MKKYILLVFCSLLVNSCTASPGGRSYIDNPRNVQHLQNSVVSIVKLNATTHEVLGPTCTAFFVSPTLMATAYHCLELSRLEIVEIAPGIVVQIPLAEEAVGKTVLFVTRQQYEEIMISGLTEVLIHEATVVQASEENDLVLLSTADGFHSQNWLPIASRAITAGETVYGMGMPSGQPWVLTHGIVSTIMLTQTGEIMHEAHVSPGASGSPLINNFGELVGINVGYMGHDYLGVAIPARHLQQLINLQRR